MDITRDVATDDAERIVHHSNSLAADRIVFLNGDNYLITKPTVESVVDILLEDNPPRYKLQTARDGRWKNITKYLTVSHAADGIDAMQRGDLQAAESFDAESLARAACQNPVVFRQAVRTVLREVTTGPRTWREPETLATIRDLLSGINEFVNDPFVNYASAYVDVTIPATTLRFKSAPTRSDAELALVELNERISKDATRYSLQQASAAVSVTLGKIYSMFDREKAAEHFKKISTGENRDIVKYFYTDTGALTYFSEGEVKKQGHDLVPSITASIKELRPSTAKAELGLVVSVDPHFFRIYGNSLLYFAQQLPDIDLNIFICGEGEDLESLLLSADAYLEALDGLNRSGTPSNVRYFRIPVPEFVEEERTFFATARFFTLQFMLSEYENIYVMDADLISAEDPRPYFRKLKNVSFSVPQMHSFQHLSPWRRHMAGNLAVNRRALSSEIIEDLQDYIAYGIQFESSWMLDQNALTYAIERNRQAFSDLSPFDRPFNQPKFRSSWEGRYWGALRGKE